MRRILLGIVILFFLLSISSLNSLVFAQNNLRGGEVVRLEKDEVIERDYFAAGEKVVLSGTVNGDAFLAGGNLTVEGKVDGDLLIAGGNINISGEVTGDVRVAGGEIDITGTIGGNLTTAGGSVSINDSAKISGSLVAGAGNLEIFAPIPKGMTIGAGAITLADAVGSDAVVGAGDLSLTSNASVNGDLTYYSQEQADIDKNASISGKVNFHKTEKEIGAAGEAATKGASTELTLASFIASLILGLLLIAVVPNFVRRGSDLVRERTLQTLGIGFASIILIPIICFILLITILGIPLAILLISAFALLWMLSKILVAIVIGREISKLLKKNINLPLALILGLLILYLLYALPFIGVLVYIATVLIGMGAYLTTKISLYREFRKKELI